MRSKRAHALGLFLLFSLSLLFSKSDAGSLGVYWGQNAGEGHLSRTCKTGLFRIVNIAFLSTFGNGSQPLMNLAGHCSPSSNGCERVGRDIRYCQRRGIKVMLSIGGGSNNYSLSSQDDARNVADYIWNHFLGGKSKKRPFGRATLDGVDFDIEGGELHYAALAYRLHDHYATSNKKFYLTAAPQCPFQDNLLHGALSTDLFDHVWVQFYNNPQCEFSSNDPSGFKSAWSQWTTSINAAKFFVGLPASHAAARTGFVPPHALINQLLPFVLSPKYGGVMLWDRFHDLQSGYSRKIRRKV
ncbi:basic endochitinase-like [Vigna unguiculata]|uniref:Acidic endochitinase n=1 Tax=Vigna unguiculata TaxID=3917 RepID=A0A4D6LWR8_VIGUN|nr:basic endochitinase-like [Vigna unguiculata]QCD92923.1 chitinase [Vigna unguiculata]